MNSSGQQHPSHAHRRLSSEGGVALIVALMAMLFMMALGSALMLSTTMETRISNNFRLGSAALYAADAGLELSMVDLLTIPDWNTMLAGTAASAFIDGGPGDRTLADGSTLNLNEVLAQANCQQTSCSWSDLTATTPERPWGMNNPQWQLYAYGLLDNIIPASISESPFYVVVMVGDDPSEDDGDPLRDGAAASNPGKGVIALRAEAFGPFGVHKVIEQTVARTDSTELEGSDTGSAEPPSVETAPHDAGGVRQPGVRILSWREVR